MFQPVEGFFLVKVDGKPFCTFSIGVVNQVSRQVQGVKILRPGTEQNWCSDTKSGSNLSSRRAKSAVKVL